MRLPLDSVTLLLRFQLAVALSVVLPLSGQAQKGEIARSDAPCVKVSFGSWQPPLDWIGSGHADSAAAFAEKVRKIRDSVYSGAGARTRDEMLWTVSNGRQQLVIFPSWWPAGVAITFAGTLGDTLSGEARALVADLASPISVARARVVRAPCGSE